MATDNPKTRFLFKKSHSERNVLALIKVLFNFPFTSMADTEVLYQNYNLSRE